MNQRNPMEEHRVVVGGIDFAENAETGKKCSAFYGHNSIKAKEFRILLRLFPVETEDWKVLVLKVCLKGSSRVVGDGAEHGNDGPVLQNQPSLFGNAVVQNQRELLSAHFQMVLVRIGVIAQGMPFNGFFTQIPAVVHGFSPV